MLEEFSATFPKHTLRQVCTLYEYLTFFKQDNPQGFLEIQHLACIYRKSRSTCEKEAAPMKAQVSITLYLPIVG